MRLWGSSNRSGFEDSRTSRCKEVRLLRMESKELKLRRLKLHGQNAPKTASPRHCEKIVLLRGT